MAVDITSTILNDPESLFQILVLYNTTEKKIKEILIIEVKT